MITPEQLQFQAPAGADHQWVETYLIPVVVPEEHVYALIYVCVRPGLGVMSNQVFVTGSLSDNRSDLLHYNDNQHLPAPDSLLHVKSPLGLEITAVRPPRDYRIDYVGFDGTEIHVDWKGLMDPFDIHDPDHSPQAGRVEDMHADVDARETHPAGHFDLTGHITGTITARGRTFNVDSVERMDHSWGPRDPMAIKNMYIVSASFGTDLAYHMICPWTPDEQGTEQFALTHGYVLENGEVYGLTDKATIASTHFGLICTSLDMEVTDVRGVTHQLSATADVGAPWSPYPSAITYNSMMRWRSGGRDGYGVVLPNYSLPWLNQRRGRFFDAPPPTVWV